MDEATVQRRLREVAPKGWEVLAGVILAAGAIVSAFALAPDRHMSAATPLLAVGAAWIGRVAEQLLTKARVRKAIERCKPRRAFPTPTA